MQCLIDLELLDHIERATTITQSMTALSRLQEQHPTPEFLVIAINAFRLKRGEIAARHLAHVGESFRVLANAQPALRRARRLDIGPADCSIGATVNAPSGQQTQWKRLSSPIPSFGHRARSS